MSSTMPRHNRHKHSRGPNQQQAGSADLPQPSYPPSFDNTNPLMMEDAGTPYAPPGGIPSLDQGLQALTIYPNSDQSFHQQPHLSSIANLPDEQLFRAAPLQSSTFTTTPPQSTSFSSIDSIAGADGNIGQGDFVHGRSLSLTVFPGSRENSPESSHTLNEADPQDKDPTPLQQVNKKGKRRASQSLMDDTPASKRSEAEKYTNKFVQEQQKGRHASPSDKKKKNQDLLKNFDKTYKGARPTKKTSKRPSPAQWPDSQSYYTRPDGNTDGSSNNVDNPDAAEEDPQSGGALGPEEENWSYQLGQGYQ